MGLERGQRAGTILERAAGAQLAAPTVPFARHARASSSRLLLKLLLRLKMDPCECESVVSFEGKGKRKGAKRKRECEMFDERVIWCEGEINRYVR